MTKYTTAGLHAKVGNALSEFFREDIDLLCLNAHEISITHKLAEHLQREFEGLKVDCEYNRLGDDPKKVSDDQKVRPDVVVHKRGRKGSNELVVEVKKSNSEDQSDDEYKLKEFTRDPGCYEYQLGLFLKFGVRKQSGLKHAECYQCGKKTPSSCPYCKSLLNSFNPSTINTTIASQSLAPHSQSFTS